MIYTPENADKAVRGVKDNTRRLFRTGDEEVWGIDETGKPAIVEVRRNGRSLYRVGKVEAIQPGRGKKGIGFQRTTAIRREWVQDISWQGALAEGIDPQCNIRHPETTPVEDFADLWDGIHAKKGERWADNPEVWVISFGLVRE